MNTGTSANAAPQRRGPLVSRLRVLGTLLAAIAGLLLALASPAGAGLIEPGFDELEIYPSNEKAGGHPDVKIHYVYRHDDEFECTEECLYPKHITVDWPEGFIGNPHVTPKCTLTEFNTQRCPSDAQIGVFYLNDFGFYVPVYNMQTRPDQAGLLGLTAPLIGFPVLLELSGRTDSDYGLRAETSVILRLPLPDQDLDLWGVPQAPEHDIQRFVSPLEGGGLCQTANEGCLPGEGFTSPTFETATTPPGPFLQNPTVCGVPLTVTGRIEYYGGTIGGEDLPWPATTSCNQASFTPSITAKLTTTEADSPGGGDVELRVPQTQSPDTPAPSELKLARLTLPEGISLNPNAADGKVACPDFLNGIGTLGPATCPETSKVGTVILDVAALPAPIPGALYLVEPRPGEPYRVLLTASGFATHVKLLGRADTNSQTGQVSVVFPDLPQAPLQEFDLHVFGAERGLFASPAHCGNYEMQGEFVPWNDALETRTSTNTITIDSGPNGTPCPVGARPLNPGLRAGVANTTAGSHASFSLDLTRGDGEQNLTAISVATPPGLIAKLSGVPYCPEAAIALLSNPAHTGVDEQNAPACPLASQIGTAWAGAGAGSLPLYVPGKVYFAGPYKGAPLSLVTVIPAVSGPYDLGNVAVRAAIHVNPVNARITVASDPLPQILDGIPLRGRSVLINLDRPNFTLNPTNCRPSRVWASTFGDEGGQATSNSLFQVANCADLDFDPKFGLKLRGATKRRGHPALRAVVRRDASEANLRRTVVAMPKSLLLDNAHIGTVCTRVQFAADACPAASRYGRATVQTPILDQPLSGPVYLRSSSNRLPDLVVDLRGQIDIELAGKIDTTKRGGLRTTFNGIPDAPFTKFVLDLQGGKKGLLLNSVDLCKARPKASLNLRAQNGMRERRGTRLQLGCRKGAAKRSNHHRPAGSGKVR